MARGGEVFVLDMGEPVRIADLARTMIHLSGLTERTPEHADGDIAIEYVGLRPGEKLYEELLIGESVVPSGHPRIMCARERHIEPALLDKMLESLANRLRGQRPRDHASPAAQPGARVPLGRRGQRGSVGVAREALAGPLGRGTTGVVSARPGQRL